MRLRERQSAVPGSVPGPVIDRNQTRLKYRVSRGYQLKSKLLNLHTATFSLRMTSSCLPSRQTAVVVVVASGSGNDSSAGNSPPIPFATSPFSLELPPVHTC